MTLGKSMGLEVDDDDMEEVVEDHNMELTTRKPRISEGTATDGS